MSNLGVIKARMEKLRQSVTAALEKIDEIENPTDLHDARQNALEEFDTAIEEALNELEESWNEQ